MKAVVLAGGQGARLTPYTKVLPKPLLPVGERPILELILGQLREAGVGEVVLATGYLSGLIEAYFGDGERFGLSISYSREDEPLGTAGPLTRIEGLDAPFILMNGDVLTSYLYPDLLDTHRRSGAAATIATQMQAIRLDYGVVRLGAEENGARRIEGFEEKPRFSWPVSTGVYVFEPHVIEHIPDGLPYDLPDLVQRLIATGEHVAAYEHEGYWMDIGQLHHLEAALHDQENAAVDIARDNRTPDRPVDPAEASPSVGRFNAS
jgi:NDP-sugar pyrophosphorylase family protein